MYARAARRLQHAVLAHAFLRSGRPRAGGDELPLHLDVAGLDPELGAEPHGQLEPAGLVTRRRRPRARRCRAGPRRASAAAAPRRSAPAPQQAAAAARLAGSRRSSRATVSTAWPPPAPRAAVRNAISRASPRSSVSSTIRRRSRGPASPPAPGQHVRTGVQPRADVQRRPAPARHGRRPPRCTDAPTPVERIPPAFAPASALTHRRRPRRTATSGGVSLAARNRRRRGVRELPRRAAA